MQPQLAQSSPVHSVVRFVLGLVGFALIGGALLAVLSAVGVIGYDPAGSAIVKARDAVKERLVSPGSAKFPVGLSEIAARTDDGKFVIAYIVVDSQNRFGAMLRSQTLVLLGRVGEAWQVLDTRTFETSPTIRDVRALSEELGTGWRIEKWLEG